MEKEEGESSNNNLAGDKIAFLEDGTATPDFSGARSCEGTATPDIQGSPEDDDDSLLGSQDDEPSVNPEPPRELAEGRLIDAETIGGTVFSKHWLFTTLMNLIQAVDSETQRKEETEASEYGVDLEESLQDELCKLWDMAMNPEVVNFLQEFKAIDILTGVIAKSKAPRAVEICVGILGNMACNDVICREMSANDKLRELLLLMLDNPDAPTLVEAMRLLHVCVSTPVAQDAWISSIKQEESVFPNVSFILSSSTNNDLLQSTAEFTDTFMYQDESLCQKWSCDNLVKSLLEAFKQIGSVNSTTFETFLHIFQLMSTCESGVQSLVAYAGPLAELTLNYLVKICEDDIVLLEDRQNGIGSALSVLVVLCSSWKESLKFVIGDYQLIRCTLKLLNVLYPKYEQLQKTQLSEPIPEPLTDTEHAQSDSDKQTNENAEENKMEESKTKEEIETESSGSESEVKSKSPTQESYQKKMVQMLYDVLQGQVVELVSLISQLPEKKDDTPTPKSLTYLETMCERPRLRCMLLTMRDTEINENKELISVLQQAAAIYELERVERIIVDTLSNGVS